MEKEKLLKKIRELRFTKEKVIKKGREYSYGYSDAINDVIETIKNIKL